MAGNKPEYGKPFGEGTGQLVVDQENQALFDGYHVCDPVSALPSVSPADVLNEGLFLKSTVGSDYPPIGDRVQESTDAPRDDYKVSRIPGASKKSD